MFTGIIECISSVEKIEKDKGNLNISLKSPITKELKIDQSLCHNGVCLTVVDIIDDIYSIICNSAGFSIYIRTVIYIFRKVCYFIVF